jgi:aspartate kinase
MTNANTIDLIVDEKECSPHLLAELNEVMEQVTTSPVAIVCAIGSNIAQPGIMAKAAQALAYKSINIVAVSQTNRQTNIQFIVERDQFAEAQIALHAALCV